MNNLILDKDGNFTVQDSVLINYISGFIFLSLFFGVLVTRNFERNDTISSFYLIYLFFLIGIVVSFIKAKRRKVFIIINSNGIYYQGKLITTWGNFVNAYITQDEYEVNNYSAGISDKFKIVIVFFDPTVEANYVHKMPVPSTSDKSEYEIISAISHFSAKQLSFEII